MKNLNFVAGMTRRFVSANRLLRVLFEFQGLVEHRAQSPVREVKMLAVWPSIMCLSRKDSRPQFHELYAI